MIRDLWRRREPVSREELARLLPAPGDPVLPDDRRLQLEEHLMDEITRGTASGTAGDTGGARRPYRRMALIAAPLAVALAVGGVAVLGQSSDGDGGGDGPQTPPVSQPLTLAQAIDHISQAAAGQDVPVPRPDQFIYIESQVSYVSGEIDPETGEEHSEIQDLHRRETWMSPDGTEGWLIEPYSQSGNGEPIGGSTPENPPDDYLPGNYDYVSTLPTDPDELLRLIYEIDQGEGASREERAFTAIGDILREQLLPPDVSAALYEAAGQIPGVELVERVPDATGREGIAVSFLSEEYGERIEWIFDNETYEYLGERVVQVAEGGSFEPGTVIGYTAVTDRAVVDELRERPEPSTT